MHKSRSVDQLDAAPLARVEAQLKVHPTLMAAQGSVVASWRTRGGRRFGPYFRAAFRDGGRQRSIYLGASAELAAEAGCLLADHQRSLRQRRQMAGLLRQARRALRAQKARVLAELDAAPAMRALARQRLLRWLGAAR